MSQSETASRVGDLAVLGKKKKEKVGHTCPLLLLDNLEIV